VRSARAKVNAVGIAVLDEVAPAWVAAFRRFCLRLLRAADIEGAEVSVLLTGDRRMRELNRRYRRVDRTTDVLSFSQTADADGPPSGSPAAPMGDIVLSLPAVGRNAARFGVPVEQELKRLVVHGLLHLAGWDHRGTAERSRMMARQEALVAAMEGEKVL
jgi:probable rRNA maturation factor